MNHLRELIECVQIGALTYGEGLPDDYVAAVEDQLPGLLENSVCFFGGDIDELPNIKPIPELQRLPFKIAWVEFDDQRQHRHQTIAFLCIEREITNPDFSLPADVMINHYHAFIRQGKNLWRYLVPFHVTKKGKVVYDPRILLMPDGITPMPLEVTRPLSILICSFISALNCRNVNRVEHTQDRKLQRARAKKGKQPLFDYWTLEVDLKKSKAAGVDMGGTHSSPRLHLRRGHTRQYAPGKYCWVQPCVVGDGAIGVVGKDYLVKV